VHPTDPACINISTIYPNWPEFSPEGRSKKLILMPSKHNEEGLMSLRRHQSFIDVVAIPDFPAAIHTTGRSCITACTGISAGPACTHG
jgi:hypothetical protein